MADRRLLVWSLASFHAAGFTLGFVLPAYLSGGLSDVLPEFGTVPGFLGYGYLWALSYLATRWALTPETVDAVVDGSPWGGLLRGAVGGALVGIGFLLGPLLVLAVPDLVTGGADVLPFLYIAALGAGVAAVVGGAIGLVFAALDLAAARSARALVGSV